MVRRPSEWCEPFAVPSSGLHLPGDVRTTTGGKADILKWEKMTGHHHVLYHQVGYIIFIIPIITDGGYFIIISVIVIIMFIIISYIIIPYYITDVVANAINHPHM